LKKGILAIAMFALALLLVAAVGCGNKTTIQTPQGSAQVEDQGGNSNITINQGGESATLGQSQNAPTEAELGAPIYPGAEYDAENSGYVNYSNQQGSAITGTAQFLTGDSFSDVVSWYSGKLGGPVSSTSTSADWLIGELSTGNYSAVHVEKGDGKTKISITHMAASVN
jgi:hypothetical protein